MATFIPGGLFSVSSLSSPMMVLRDKRLKETKVHAERTQRDLARDRMNLERKEKQLLQECKRLAKKGDMTGARLIANQIARYRRLHDRNLESSVLIGTKAQAMVSDHKVNKAEVETVKGFAYANMYENFARMEAREQRYAFRMGAIDHMERGTRDGMDNMFRGEEEGAQLMRIHPEAPADAEDAVVMRGHEFEVHTILQQALNNGRRRVYQQPDLVAAGGSSSNPMVHMMPGMLHSNEPPFVLNVKLADRPNIGAAVTLSQTPLDPTPFLPMLSTVDAVKRKVIQDTFAVSQLNLYSANGILRSFQLGRLASTGEFTPFDFSETVAGAGLHDGSTVYVKVLAQDPLHLEQHRNSLDEEIREVRERMNRINMATTKMNKDKEGKKDLKKDDEQSMDGKNDAIFK